MCRDMARPVILLLGANGQVGSELRRTLPAIGSVVALDVPEVDFSQPESLREIIRIQRPNIIVNAAAYTAVDKAENESKRAFAINADAPRVLAEEAEALGVCLVHFSTDYVFDGRKPSPYVETDATWPLSIYGRSKLLGEQAIQVCKKHLTFRTSWVISAHGQNFVKTILRLAGERDILRVVSDQFGAPTSASLLASITVKIMLQMAERPADDARWGLYHLVAAGETSWHGLACHVVARATAMGLSLKTQKESVMPITTAEYPTPAARPANSRLSTSKLCSTFSLALPDWTKGVNEVLDHLIPAMLT
jgi:dTDP-4-dehydrorhamnose reductase